jgi:hypothetical protein
VAGRPGFDPDKTLPEHADEVRQNGGATIGLAVLAREMGEDTTVEIAAVGPWGVSQSRQTAFLGGEEGRRRAGVAAAAFLLRTLREQPLVADNTRGSDVADSESGSKA